MKKQLSAETLRKRKFLMVLPLLVFPFMTMAFWALGGGKGMPDKDLAKQSKEGFNTDLPDAKFNLEEKNDKFSIYQISARESANADEESVFKGLAFPEDAGAVDPNEQKINEKLAQITTELNRTTQSSGEPYSTTRIAANQQASNMGADVNRLENLMQSLQEGNEDDKEMAQLNSILEKVLEIQNPSRVREKQKENLMERSTGTFSVHVADGQEEKQGLYALARNINAQYAEISGNAIGATIHQDQEIVAGSVIKLRLLDSIYVRGTLIPRNEFVYGIASIDDERLKIDIPTLRYKNSILPVSLSAFDLDGLEGLYIPGAITRDASKKGVEEAVQSLQIMTMDPSVSAQVAGAGVQAAKGLFSRKVKQVRVKLKAGYQLLLRDNSQRN
ncbi:conjugative transposon protein TraM [Pedobacter sp. SYSU D00535]|uniref:conjugative transposon protein TraM n=1 Tax=Pedobacter sp. SYSU D00535 TaxID=2810308 RepID=UPI001A96C0CD|nr:conjugative transposon protein TraM [Pedobacter sp. SYSU D00535]